MVVLTPNDQFRNTAYRVGEHNYDTICQEFQRAYKILKQLKESSKILIKEKKEEVKYSPEQLKEQPSQESGGTGDDPTHKSSSEDELELVMNEVPDVQEETKNIESKMAL